MMWLPSVLVSACLLTATVSAGSVRRQSDPPEECLDPKNQTGTCGTIFECPQLSAMVGNGRVPSPDQIEYLKKSVCRQTATRGFVCCPWTPDNHPNKQLLKQGGICGTYVDPRIRGGNRVPLGKHPWMAVLFYSLNGKVTHECGGALISQQHVLTAAHCIPRPEAGHQLIAVRLGEHDLTSNVDCQVWSDGTRICSNKPQTFRIEKQFVHENHNSPNERDNDIALLKLDRPVVEDLFVGKICLPFGISAHRDYTGVNMTVAGFGRTGPYRFSGTSKVLMEVTLPVVSDEHCRAAYEKYNGVIISDYQICAGGEHHRDSCGGDSGGPVIVGTPTGPPYTLVGIVSYGIERCGEGGIPSVNTRVSEYMNWILDRLDD